MIGRLRGVLVEKQAPVLLLDIAGVGYNVQASMHTFCQLPALGHEVVLHTHFVVREDAQQLYGFLDLAERALFQALIKVNGIGPRTAISILSSITPDSFAQYILNQDVSSLSRLPGIGKKTAERLVIEMRDYGTKRQEEFALLPTGKLPLQDALSGLIALGYKPQEASKALSKLAVSDDTDSAELIRLVLKNMMKA